MKTKSYLLLAAILFSLQAKGQDTLLYKSGGSKVVRILSENSSKIFFQLINAPADEKRNAVKKKLLKEIRYHNDSMIFVTMSPSDFNSLGQKHAKEYGSPFEKLLNNPNYMSGYNKSYKLNKERRITRIILATVSIATLVITAATIPSEVGEYMLQ